MKRLLGLLLALALLAGARPMAAGAEKSPWVILVYLAGTDLETEGAAATLDLLEMVEGTADGSLRFLVQTGGTREWAVPELIPNDRLSRFEVGGQDLAAVHESPLASMGAAETLRDFVDWGLANYPAERYGLILWDHGSGSINGVVFDELFDMDSLSLKELGEALAGFGKAFEFIGFDACLMATLETAQAVMPYAHYMVASEELEPGSGWDYEGLGQFLAENPGAGGDAVGKAIADGFLASNTALGEEALTTLSVTDLSKIPALTEALNTAGWQMFEAMSLGGEALGGIVKGIRQAENYGGNTPEEGYTNMVDIAGMMRGVQGRVPGAEAVLGALRDAVVYQVTGTGRQGAGGLSMYYPLMAQGSSEYQIFKDASHSEGYRYFVAGMMYGAANGDTAGLAAQNEMALEQALPQGGDNAEEAGLSSSEISQVSIVDAYLDDEGTFTLQLDKDSVQYLYSAGFMLLMDEGEGIYYNLGEDDEVGVDLENGLIRDMFSGLWTALPDGQLLPLFLLDSRGDYNLYSAPVLLNGRQTNLRALYDWEAEAFRVLGGWDGVLDSGAAAKDLIPIEEGDSLTPLYDAYDSVTDAYLGLEEGVPYTVPETLELVYMQLPAADYYYAFSLQDLYGLRVYTDFARFMVDEAGGLWFYE